jgi:hypothetical protein
MRMTDQLPRTVTAAIIPGLDFRSRTDTSPILPDRASGFHGEAVGLAKIIAGNLISDPDPHVVRAIEEGLIAAYKAGRDDGQMDLRSALRVLLHEVIQAGFGTAKDYNWPQAIAGARSALGDPNAE